MNTRNMNTNNKTKNNQDDKHNRTELTSKATLGFSLVDKLQAAGLVEAADVKRAEWWRRERRRRQIATLTAIKFDGLASDATRAAFNRLERHENVAILRDKLDNK